MNVDELNLPEAARQYIRGYASDTLYPPQEQAVGAGLLEGASLMVSAPTASGKTLVAMMAVVAMLERGGRRAAYLSPLRALAAEKHSEFRELQRIPLENPVRASVSTGDLSSRDRLSGNLISMTNERMDLALRRDEGWLDEVDLVIADEVHLIGDPARGPTLEMVLTRLRRDGRQFVGLSATITNAAQLARWMGCKLVSSFWRPVPLTEGVCFGGTVTMDDGSTFEVARSSRGAAVDLALQSIRSGDQALLFVNTRRGAPSQATRASKAVSGMLKPSDARRLEAASSRILRDGENTEMTKTLASLVRHGVAFHHAGLEQSSRRAIEDGFRRGYIKMLAATPTLAAGVNLPARRVIISDITRYDGRYGRNMPISVLEYKQFCGRAGRPQYDDSGEAIIVARGNADEIMDEYVRGTPEPVESAISGPGPLSVHALSVVVSEPGITAERIHEFFGRTLGGWQQGESIRMDVDRALDTLEELDMIDTLDGSRWAATRLGELTSRLYLTPKTAHRFLEVAKEAAPGERAGGRLTLGLLYAIASCEEFLPVLGLRQKDYEAAYNLVATRGSEMISYIDPGGVSRSLLGMYGWVSEESEADISERYGVESGDTRRMVESGRWLARCMAEIARYAKLPGIRSELEVLRARIVHGVKEELVPLVSIRGVGRVRGRALYRAGARSTADVAAMPVSRIAEICRVGRTAAEKMKAGAAR